MSQSQWWWSDAHRERWQREQIEDLNSSVSVAYNQTSRLRSQLATMQGSLESRVTRLSVAFEAFVELSDIRAELAVHSDAALVRHRARLLLAAVTAGRKPEPLDLPDVAGYWLVPAARALHARLVGDSALAGKHGEEASRLDAARTRCFLAGVLRLGGPVDLAAVELVTLLPTADRAEVNRAQRQFWLATAAGAFGEAGRGMLANSLAAALKLPESAEDDPWVASIDRGAPAQSLAALRERCSAAEPDVPATGAEIDPVATPLRELVTALLEEGHVPERDLLRRIEQLRGLVESGTEPPPYRSWDEPAGTVGELVRADFVTDDAPPGTHSIAIRAAAPLLRTVAATIAERGRVAPPDRITARIRNRDVVITGTGPDAATLSALRRDAAAGYQPRRTWQQLGIGAAFAGLIVASIGFAGLGGVGVGVLGIIVALIGTGVAVSGAREAAATLALGEAELDKLDEASRRAVEEYRSARERADEECKRVDEEFAAFTAALGST